MDKKFVDILQQLVKDLNNEGKIGKFLEKTSCKSYLDDYTRGDFKNEKSFFLRVLEVGVAKEIYTTDDLANCKKKQVRVLVEAYNPKEASIEIVDILAFLLRGDTTKTVKQQEKKEEAPVKQLEKKEETSVKQPPVQPSTNDIIFIKPKEGSDFTFGSYKWLVLKTQNDRALIITQDIIKQMRFHASSNVYSNSEVRNYLINDFYNSFNNKEKKRILQDTETKDKIFLLSVEQANYYYANDTKRVARYNGSACFWWLRSPGGSSGYASYVFYDGDIYLRGFYVYGGSGGVRPALWLNL